MSERERLIATVAFSAGAVAIWLDPPDWWVWTLLPAAIVMVAAWLLAPLLRRDDPIAVERARLDALPGGRR